MTGFSFSAEPPSEVSAYFRQKGDRPAFRWSEVWGEEHAYAFTVAKATSADVLGAIRESLQTAIDKGVPYDQWARDLKPSLQAKGWWGDAVEMADPATGEVKPRELGTPRRLRIIYDANLRSARAAGQWERGQRTKAVLPFYLYQLGPSEKHRPEHVAKEGVVRPVDDPFWTAWFPPNGWGCKCWLRQITKAEATRRGVTPPFDVPNRTFSRTLDDGSTERVTVPQGIDPGWQTNPGLNRAKTLMTNMADRLIASGEPAARALMTDFWKGSTPEAFTHLPTRTFAPAAIAPARLQKELGTEALLVMVSSDTLKIKLEKHGVGERGLKAADLGRLQAILDDGQLVERTGANAVYAMEMDGGWYQAVVKTSAKGELILASLFPIGARKVRRLGLNK